MLFKNTKGEYVLHRVKKIKNGIIHARGDALTTFDEPIKREGVIATAIAFERNGKQISKNNILYKAFFALYTSELGLKFRKFKNKQ